LNQGVAPKNTLERINCKRSFNFIVMSAKSSFLICQANFFVTPKLYFATPFGVAAHSLGSTGLDYVTGIFHWMCWTKFLLTLKLNPDLKCSCTFICQIKWYWKLDLFAK